MDITEIAEDMSPEEKKSLAEFKSNGLPGFSKVNQNDIEKWFDLYMSGHTYTEISKVTKKKKDYIFKIYQTRQTAFRFG